MNVSLDFGKVKKFIGNTPEAKPLLDDKSDGFKHLYNTVYLPLLDEPNSEYVRLDVDITRFSFDDLASFDNFINEKCNYSYNSPVNIIDRVLTKLTPINKPTVFI